MATAHTSSFPPSTDSDSSTPPAIDVREIVCRRGTVTAVDRVSFTVRRGEFFSLLGPSGAGKTSILRLLAGFEEPDEGDILIEGRSMRGVPPNRRPVNLVFQSYALFPHLTVFENIAFGLRMRRTPSAQIAQEVQAALAMVKLPDKETRLPAQLSGGEQQRVALARALVNKPAVILLDEPLAALDQQLRQAMQVELKSIQEQAGLTCLCVTHHQEEAMMMSDRLAVMHQGRISRIGTPREVYERPNSLFTARFLGVSNELPGRIERQEGDRVRFIPTDLVQAPLWVRRGADAVVGQAAVLSLRPEQLWMTAGTSGSEEPSVQGRVEKILFAGRETKYLVRLGPDRLWEVSARSASQPAAFTIGQSVRPTWSPDDGQVFAA